MNDMSFIGQAAAWNEWCAAIASGRMHHAWLFAGPRGIGKRAFARAAASELVGRAGRDPIDVDAHPDIMVLEALPANDDEAKKKAEGKPWQAKRNIAVDQVREMIRRLATRPTLGDRRAIIIDPADELETGAVNALLKALEEPPVGTYFILLAHQPGRLLPTVRSRCRVLRFAALNDRELETALLNAYPESTPQTRRAAISASAGSPGMALSFVAQDLAEIHALMLRIVHEGDTEFFLRGALADEMGARPNRERQLAALELARTVVSAEVAGASPSRQSRLIDAHSALMRLSRQAPTYNFDAGLLIMEIGGLLASTAMPREAARL